MKYNSILFSLQFFFKFGTITTFAFISDDTFWCAKEIYRFLIAFTAAAALGKTNFEK